MTKFIINLNDETSDYSFWKITRTPCKHAVKAFALELGNRSGRVGFVFVSNLNGLRISRPEPNSFIKWVGNPLPISI